MGKRQREAIQNHNTCRVKSNELLAEIKAARKDPKISDGEYARLCGLWSLYKRMTGFWYWHAKPFWLPKRFWPKYSQRYF